MTQYIFLDFKLVELLSINTCNTTRLPARFKASTDTACETFTTDMSLTLVITSLTLRRLSFEAAPPGMSLVM